MDIPLLFVISHYHISIAIKKGVDKCDILITERYAIFYVCVSKNFAICFYYLSLRIYR